MKSFPEKTYIYSVQRGCENLQTGSKMVDFTCNNQETDTVIFFISHTLRKHGFLPEERKHVLRMHVRTSMKPKNYWKISASL